MNPEHLRDIFRHSLIAHFATKGFEQLYKSSVGRTALDFLFSKWPPVPLSVPTSGEIVDGRLVLGFEDGLVLTIDLNIESRQEEPRA